MRDTTATWCGVTGRGMTGSNCGSAYRFRRPIILNRTLYPKNQLSFRPEREILPKVVLSFRPKGEILPEPCKISRRFAPRNDNLRGLVLAPRHSCPFFFILPQTSLSHRNTSLSPSLCSSRTTSNARWSPDWDYLQSGCPKIPCERFW